jgi:outer membrane receptor protein involved in Fe transport
MNQAARLRSCLTLAAALALWAGVFPGGPVTTPAMAQPVEDTSLDDAPPVAPPEPSEPSEPPPNEGAAPPRSEADIFGIGEEFSLDARDRVISAARTETTIQEAPAIVTVITREEIRARGFRTIIEVLQTIPGFEGDRSEGNGWITEAFARGNPRTILILLNGINIVEPVRNAVVLDRKIPLAIVDRIEIISGPGGVLWGSNALLGVVNITTVDARDLDGWRIMVGGGSGPGDLGAVETNATYGVALSEDVELLVNLNFYSSRGPALDLDEVKVVGALPAPDPDGLSLFQARSATTDPSRDWFASGYLSFRAGPFTLSGIFQREQDHRQLGFGGGLLTEDLRSPEVAARVGAVDVETVGEDALWMLSAQYRDRFAGDDVGVSVTGYLLRWLVREDPFGSFPASDQLPHGFSTVFFDQGLYRPGVNVDADVVLPENNHLVFGAEFFADVLQGVSQTFPVDPTDPDSTATRTEQLVTPETRFIGALYLSDEWRASDRIALNAGARLQLSNTYDAAALVAGALVWNVFGQTFLKLNYTEGFRPPQLQATNTNPSIESGVTFNANPDLDVERSRAAEAELNTVLLEDAGAIDRLFLRADYSFTVIDDLIDNTTGGFINSGTRYINSVEVLGRLAFQGEHELALSYYWVDVEDAASGPVRNVANHIVNGHARAQLVPNVLHFAADLTWIGPREDANRRLDPEAEAGGIVVVRPSDIVVDRLEPVWLVRAGLVADGLADSLRLSVFGHNVLDQDYTQPDPFFDDRVQSRPFPMPRWSVFASAEVSF